jgi:hypothetical protein
MTFISKSVRRVLFDDRVRRTRSAFYAACKPFYDQLAALKKEADAFQESVDRGIAQWSEYDEETGAGWDHGEEFGERRQDAEDGLLMVRKAFVVVIYHLWERGAQRWAPQVKKKPNHENLIAALAKTTVAVDENGLEELRLLVNCLKHNSEDGRKLYISRRGLFADDFDPDAVHPGTGKPFAQIDWAENVVLTDANVEDCFRVVQNSGPK